MVLMALCMVQVLQAIETLASAAPTGEDVAAVRALQDSARAAIDKLASEAPENVELWAKLAAAALRGGLHGPAVRAARGALELPADRRSESLAQAASTFAAGEQLPPPPPPYPHPGVGSPRGLLRSLGCCGRRSACIGGGCGRWNASGGTTGSPGHADATRCSMVVRDGRPAARAVAPRSRRCTVAHSVACRPALPGCCRRHGMHAWLQVITRATIMRCMTGGARAHR